MKNIRARIDQNVKMLNKNFWEIGNIIIWKNDQWEFIYTIFLEFSQS